MASRGRGRGLTLPAWMTTNEGGDENDMNSCTATNVNSDIGMNGGVSNGNVHNALEMNSSQQAMGNLYNPKENDASSMAIPAVQTSAVPLSTPTSTTTPSPSAGMQQQAYQQYSYPQQYPSSYPSFPGQPGQSAYPQVPGGYPPHMMPPYMPPGVMPVGAMASSMPRGLPSRGQPTSNNAPSLNDPLNDVKSWSEHVSDVDKRVYWYNKVTKTSTYDKPECLKCPEERSIPPCRWKEYSKDGKIYYSDGKESTWTAPEEFLEWKSRVDAAIERRKLALQGSQSTSSNATTKKKSASMGNNDGTGSDSSKPNAKESDLENGESTEGIPDVVTYANETEAANAFKQMLTDHSVTAVAKFKDVQELCSKDQRWNACKTVGARKQALSEYQTQKLKSEREEKRMQARKNRDMFFQLLAETTEIDSRTRWRDAQTLLKNDRRYKQVESDIEREDYFKEFIAELTKKEKEDLMELKKAVKSSFVTVLDDMVAAGKIKRNAIWADVKDDILGRIDSKFNTLEDSDRRHMFQDYMIDLENKFLEQEKAAAEESKRKLKDLQAQFRTFLQSQAASGTLTSSIKWREFKPTIATDPSFITLLRFVNENDPSYSPANMEMSSSLEGGPRDVFDDVVTDLIESEEKDKRLLRRIFEDGIEFKSKISGEYEMLVDEITHESSFNDTKTQIEDFISSESITEDDRDFKYKSPLKEILSQRLQGFEKVFHSIVKEKIEEEEVRKKKQRKYEDRYLDLLDDYYYRSDHVGIKWEEAKRELSKRSAYLDLSRDVRKSLFEEHMRELAAELAKKSSSFASKSVVHALNVEHEEGEIDVGSDENVSDRGELQKETEGDVASRKRSASRSRSYSRDHSRSPSRDKKRANRDDDYIDDNERTKSKHSHKHKHSSDDSGKRKRHDSKSDGWDSLDEAEEHKERKSKKSKKEKKEKKSHKHKHKSHRDRSYDSRS